MDQSRRDLMRFGGLGFLGIATGVHKTPEGILLPHDKIITQDMTKAEALIMASGYITSISMEAQIETMPRMSLGIRSGNQRIISSTQVDMNLEFEPNCFNVHESFYDHGPMKVVVYR